MHRGHFGQHQSGSCAAKQCFLQHRDSVQRDRRHVLQALRHGINGLFGLGIALLGFIVHFESLRDAFCRQPPAPLARGNGRHRQIVEIRKNQKAGCHSRYPPIRFKSCRPGQISPIKTMATRWVLYVFGLRMGQTRLQQVNLTCFIFQNALG